MGRIIPEQTYTEYFHGFRDHRLHLRQGPLVSVTSVNAVEYSNDGAGNRSETLTAVVQADRLEGGLRSENYKGLGWIELDGYSNWTRGQRNYKVVYIAGYDPIPEGLVNIATTHVCMLFQTRETLGLNSKSIGDGDINPLSPRQIDTWLEFALRPWTVRGLA